MNTFSLEQLRKDASAWVDAPGRSRLQLARLADVDWKSLDRFLSNKDNGLSGKTIEKLWPHIYGKGLNNAQN